MSESRRRSEAHAAMVRAQQGSEPPWRPDEQGIEPGEAAAFRRRLDYQGSTELIPMAGPDAPADQGPAIKAVWEPAPRDGAGTAPGPASRRRDRHHATGRSGRGTGRRRRRSLIIGGVVAVALGVTGYTELSGKGPTFTKGAATTILPADSPPPDAGQSANASLGSGISLTNTPSHSPSPSRSASASASPTASHSTTASMSASPNGPSQPPPSGSPSPSPGHSSSPSPPSSPTPAQTTPRSCFLIFCN